MNKNIVERERESHAHVCLDCKWQIALSGSTFYYVRDCREDEAFVGRLEKSTHTQPCIYTFIQLQTICIYLIIYKAD